MTTTTTNHFWRVTITQRNTRQRKDWHHQFAVLAPDAETAKRKAADHYSVDINTEKISAERDDDGIMTGTTYFTRIPKA